MIKGERSGLSERYVNASPPSVKAGVTAAAQKLLLPVSVWFLFLGSQSNQKKRPHITELTAGRTRQNHPWKERETRSEAAREPEPKHNHFQVNIISYS